MKLVINAETGVALREPLNAAEIAQRDLDAAVLPPTSLRSDMVSVRRYQAEVGGTTYNGWPLATDRDSQAKINAAYTMARDGYWSGGWKFSDGTYRVLTAEQVVAMALTVSAHVQACYSHEATLLADPDADITVGWPS